MTQRRREERRAGGHRGLGSQGIRQKAFDGVKPRWPRGGDMRSRLASLARLVTRASLGCGREVLSTTPGADRAPYLFPEGFLWGVGCADHQVEHCQNDDWTALERLVEMCDSAEGRATEPPLIRNFLDYPENVRWRKTNYDEMFAEDIEAARRIGLGAYRFSISWARLFPEENTRVAARDGVDFYRRIIGEIKRHGLVPWVTLLHYATPKWLWDSHGGRRGFERTDFVRHFCRFASAAAEHFGGDVSYWCTLNEPVLNVVGGYLDGSIPPNERCGDVARVHRILCCLARAHAAAYEAIKSCAHRRGEEALVGITQHVRDVEPYRKWLIADRVLAGLFRRSLVWDFLDALHEGVLEMSIAGLRERIPEAAGTIDYVGINYYSRAYVKTEVFRPWKFKILLRDPCDPDEDVSDTGWSIFPRGVYLAVREADRRYGLPVYILENGVADARSDDRTRQEYIGRHLREIWLAIRHGADVRGYFYWSLTDNFEWAEGFGPRFGLIEVDYCNGFRRRPRRSAALYGAIAKANGLTREAAGRCGVE